MGTLPLPFLPLLSPGAGISYSFIPVQANTSLSLITLGLGGEVKFEILPRFFLFLKVLGGGYYGFFNETLENDEGVPYKNQRGGGPFFEGGGGLAFYLTPWLSIGLNGSYRNYIGLYHGIRGSLGTSFHLHGLQRQVELGEVEIENIFPVFYRYYDNHGIGNAVLRNGERFPIKNVEVDLFVEQFMDSPKPCAAPDELMPGEAGTVGLNALFLDSVLELEEGTKVAAEITVRYTLNGVKRERVAVETMRLNHRNAMTWDDDRKAAAFVSAKDPEILKFSKLTAGIVRAYGPAAVNQNLRMGMGLFEALAEYGLSYVIDPNTPSYVEASQDTGVLDFLQFPKQTLAYRGGDCDDLSILYSALLESIGIETAFITVPGHIFMAFSLGIKQEEAERVFTATDQLIQWDDRTWLPVEVTRVGDGFLEAWRVGAEQWRKNAGVDTAAFYPMYGSWRLYEAAGSPGEEVRIELPSPDNIESSYGKEIAAFVERELYPSVEKLQTAIGESNDPVKLKNRLGVLYARFGLTEKAEEIFQEIIIQRDYVPTLVNLGNIHLLRNDLDAALGYFQRVERKSPDNKTMLLNMARINFELNQFGLVRKYYTQLQRTEPELAEKFSYLASVDSSETRAEDRERVREIMVWEEE